MRRLRRTVGRRSRDLVRAIPEARADQGYPGETTRGRCETISTCATVLIVDDHPTFRRFARRLLEEAGFAVVGEAADGAAAIEAAQRAAARGGAARRPPPRRSGLEVAARARGDARPRRPSCSPRAEAHATSAPRSTRRPRAASSPRRRSPAPRSRSSWRDQALAAGHPDAGVVGRARSRARPARARSLRAGPRRHRRGRDRLFFVAMTIAIGDGPLGLGLAPADPHGPADLLVARAFRSRPTSSCRTRRTAFVATIGLALYVIGPIVYVHMTLSYPNGRHGGPAGVGLIFVLSYAAQVDPEPLQPALLRRARLPGVRPGRAKLPLRRDAAVLARVVEPRLGDRDPGDRSDRPVSGLGEAVCARRRAHGGRSCPLALGLTVGSRRHVRRGCT